MPCNSAKGFWLSLKILKFLCYQIIQNVASNAQCQRTAHLTPIKSLKGNIQHVMESPFRKPIGHLLKRINCRMSCVQDNNEKNGP